MGKQGICCFLGYQYSVLILHWLCLIGTANDPRRVNINQKIFGIIIWICPFCSLLCGGSIYVYALQGGFNFHIGISAQLFVGLLVLVLGNYLPKCRRNYTVVLNFRGHCKTKITGTAHIEWLEESGLYAEYCWWCYLF